jgi:transposase-like protein
MPTGEREDESPTGGSVEQALDSPRSGVRHRLTPDQQREVARMYSDADASAADIRQRFGIAEPSVYRILKKQGVALRGRTRGSAASDGATTRTRSVSARGRRPPRSRPHGAPVLNPDGALTQFRIEYRAQHHVDAVDIRDALRQAELLGAMTIVEITRER